MRTYSFAAGLLSASLAAAAPQGDQQSHVMQCLDGKDVPYKMASSPGYEDYAEPYNLRLAYQPLVIVLPTTDQHVQDAVGCAGQYQVKVQAKSGGHSYASFSSGGKDGIMMISLESFNKIELDQSTGIAKVGGGVRLGNLAQGIWDQGKAALSHGTCPGVGIGGHATHGGYGHTSRHWGLAIDAIIGADVVLANGTLVSTSSEKYPEIFWATRGAADSFGIVTTFSMQTKPAPESITYFEFPFQGMWDSKDTFTKSFLHIQDFAKNESVIDDRFSIGFYMDGQGSFSSSGAFFGSVDEFNEKIKPEFLRTLPAPASEVVQSYSYIDYLVKVSGADTLEVPLTGYDEHDTFFAKSITVPEEDGLSAEALNAFYDHVKSDSAASFFTIINLYGGPGSVINEKDTNFAAYADRASLWVFQNYGQGADSIDFTNGLNDAVINAQPDTHFGAYLNYVDPSYDAATAHKLYYGDEMYTRLAALKKEVDPKSVYWNPQAIGA